MLYIGYKTCYISALLYDITCAMRDTCAILYDIIISYVYDIYAKLYYIIHALDVINMTLYMIYYI